MVTLSIIRGIILLSVAFLVFRKNDTVLTVLFIFTFTLK